MESLRKKNRPAVLKGEKEAQHKEKNERTVFVGNLPISSMTKQGTKELTKVFNEHGKIDSIRFRSFAMANHMDRKGAYITKKFHNNRDEVNGYVVYKTKEEAEKAAAALDGSVYMEKHLRVDLANASPVRRGSSNQNLTRAHLSCFLLLLDRGPQTICLFRSTSIRCQGRRTMDLFQHPGL